jgi:hypothetical protein
MAERETFKWVMGARDGVVRCYHGTPPSPACQPTDDPERGPVTGSRWITRVCCEPRRW